MGVQTIFVKNLSDHPQRFQVHGWNGNKDIVVPAKKQLTIPAPDGSSGAIIAVHDGHIGEQAEITKKGMFPLPFLLLPLHNQVLRKCHP